MNILLAFCYVGLGGMANAMARYGITLALQGSSLSTVQNLSAQYG